MNHIGACSKAASNHDDARGSEEQPDRRLRILVVEDNIDHAHTLAELLTLWGHETAVAYDGLSGIERAGTFQPQVIIMDIGLPVLDGYQAARQLRANPLTRGIRLIALTGYGKDEDRRQAFAAGFDFHMTKPADLEVLRRALNHSSQAAADANGGTMDLSKGTVLLVDDEELVRNVTRRMLEHGGFGVLEASSAGQALAVMKELHGEIKLLVSDILMPGINGVELAAQVDREWPGIRILLISGHAGDHAGRIRHPVLSKPFTAHDLLRQVTELVGGTPKLGGL